jgi:hypothetical protein
VFGHSQRSLRFIVITHMQASGSFLAVAENGAEAAGRQLGVSVTYEAPDTLAVLAHLNSSVPVTTRRRSLGHGVPQTRLSPTTGRGARFAGGSASERGRRRRFRSGRQAMLLTDRRFAGEH